jgi:hypothetical protein
VQAWRLLSLTLFADAVLTKEVVLLLIRPS